MNALPSPIVGILTVLVPPVASVITTVPSASSISTKPRLFSVTALLNVKLSVPPPASSSGSVTKPPLAPEPLSFSAMMSKLPQSLVFKSVSPPVGLLESKMIALSGCPFVAFFALTEKPQSLNCVVITVPAFSASPFADLSNSTVWHVCPPQFGLAVKTQPFLASHLSIVQAFPSSQVLPAPAWQAPALQVSESVHASPSEQVPVAEP